MKKALLSLIALIVFSNLAIAQPEQDNPGPPPTKGIKRERIEAMKIGFITDKLNLSADEAKVCAIFTASFACEDKLSLRDLDDKSFNLFFNEFNVSIRVFFLLFK